MTSENKVSICAILSMVFGFSLFVILMAYRAHESNQCKIAAFGNPAINSVEMLKEVCK